MEDSQNGGERNDNAANQRWLREQQAVADLEIALGKDMEPLLLSNRSFDALQSLPYRQRPEESHEKSMFRRTEPVGAFSLLEERCQRDAENLAQGSTFLCVMGPQNSGKSTLCNLILGNASETRMRADTSSHATSLRTSPPSMEVSAVPTTAVPCVVRAGHWNGSVRVYWGCPSAVLSIEEEVNAKGNELLSRKSQVRLLADKCDDKDAARFLRSLLKDDATEREYVTVHDEDEDEVIDDGNGSDKEHRKGRVATCVSFLSSRSGANRRESAALVDRLEWRAPVLGCEEGLVLVDCPGMGESAFLSRVATENAQNAGIILFVIDGERVLSQQSAMSDSTISSLSFLSRQKRSGTDVIFVFNSKLRYGDDEHAASYCQSTYRSIVLLMTSTRCLHSSNNASTILSPTITCRHDRSAIQFLRDKLSSRPELTDAPFHVVDLKAATQWMKAQHSTRAEEDTIVTAAQQSAGDVMKRFVADVCDAARSHCMSQTLMFARTFFMWTQTQYLVLARLISLMMTANTSDRERGDFSVLGTKHREKERETAVRLRKEVSALMKKANEDIAALRKEHTELFQQCVREAEGEMTDTARNYVVSTPFVNQADSEREAKIDSDHKEATATPPPSSSVSSSTPLSSSSPSSLHCPSSSVPIPIRKGDDLADGDEDGEIEQDEAGNTPSSSLTNDHVGSSSPSWLMAPFHAIRSLTKQVSASSSNPALSSYEQELTDAVLACVLRRYREKLADWVVEKRQIFAQSLLSAAQGIEDTATALRMAAMEDTVTVGMHKMLQQSEERMQDLAKGAAIGGPLLGVAASTTAVTSGVMLIGVVSGVLLASGIALLAGLAAAGIAASIASLTYTKRKESLTLCVKSEAITQRKVSDAEQYQYLCDCLYRREAMARTLQGLADDLNDLSTSSRRRRDDARSAQSKRALSVQQRRAMTHLNAAEQVIRKWNRGANLSTITSAQGVGSTGSSALPSLQASQPRCFICRRTFTACRHLCGECRYSLKQRPCPACHKSRYLASHSLTGGKGGGEEARRELQRMLRNITFPTPSPSVPDEETAADPTPTTAIASPSLSSPSPTPSASPSPPPSPLPSPDSFFELGGEEVAVARAVGHCAPVFDTFSKWFAETHHPRSSCMEEAREALRVFVVEVMEVMIARPSLPSSALVPQPTTAAEDLEDGAGLTDRHMMMLMIAVHTELYSRVDTTLTALYRLHYTESDAKIYAASLRVSHLRPSDFQAEEDLDGLLTRPDGCAIVEALQRFESDRAVTPMDKMNCVVTAFKGFKAAVPPGVMIGADLLVPMLTFFIARAQMRRLHTCVAQMQDGLMDAPLLLPEHEYLLVTMESIAVNFAETCDAVLTSVAARQRSEST